MATANRREIPFRVMLLGNAGGSTPMWSPACVLEGQATLGGEPARLFLYANNFSASFTTFGWSQFALLPAGQKPEGYLPRSALSSLVPYKGTFYRVRLAGTYEKGKTLQVLFEKDTTPTGRLAADLHGKETLKSHLRSVTIGGATDNSINFSLPDADAPLPVGRYQLTSASLGYGADSNEPWRATFISGPPFEVQADQTSTVRVGDLTLAVRAVNEKDRSRSAVKEQTTFAKGTALYLAPQIKGKAGEVYTRFSQKRPNFETLTDVKPHLTIVNAAGKSLVSADVEYG